ncbi:HutD family protein [Ornithinimicrobium murale]|uniref:HutD/Ves family protein n=1 Tax=Ornithinimicrobium murale TaxID=1050153 RepID=UPI000E0D0255|nr:HutD family protein [Ornithinimicrobium murale]
MHQRKAHQAADLVTPRSTVTRWVDAETTPWQNGGGLTRAVATAPGTSGPSTFDWRVSIADIEAPGPFSAFPGVDRVLTLLEGGSMVLASAAGETVLVERRPHHFPGEQSVTARLPDGPTRALNLMTRRGRASGQVVVHDGGAGQAGDTRLGPVKGGARRLVVALEDGFTASGGDGQTWRLARYDVLDTTEPVALRGAPCVVITVGS